MQLKIQRSQRTNTLGRVLFCLDLRAEYSAEERGNIDRYRLGGEIIYSSERSERHVADMNAQLDRVDKNNFRETAAGLARGAMSLALAKMSLNVSVSSLARGHHIECKDLEELLEAEDTLRTACKNVTRYLEAAATFDGSETVVEYDKGEERVHITQHAPPLIELQPSAATGKVQAPPTEAYESFDVPAAGSSDSARDLGAAWAGIENDMIGFFAARGWNIGPLQIRMAIVIIVIVLFIFLANGF